MATPARSRSIVAIAVGSLALAACSAASSVEVSERREITIADGTGPPGTPVTAPPVVAPASTAPPATDPPSTEPEVTETPPSVPSSSDPATASTQPSVPPSGSSTLVERSGFWELEIDGLRPPAAPEWDVGSTALLGGTDLPEFIAGQLTIEGMEPPIVVAGAPVGAWSREFSELRSEQGAFDVDVTAGSVSTSYSVVLEAPGLDEDDALERVIAAFESALAESSPDGTTFRDQYEDEYTGVQLSVILEGDTYPPPMSVTARPQLVFGEEPAGDPLIEVIVERSVDSVGTSTRLPTAEQIIEPGVIDRISFLGDLGAPTFYSSIEESGYAPPLSGEASTQWIIGSVHEMGPEDYPSFEDQFVTLVSAAGFERTESDIDEYVFYESTDPDRYDSFLVDYESYYDGGVITYFGDAVPS